MSKIVKIIIFLIPFFIFSQKKIEKIGAAEGVIFETKNYNRKEILCYAKDFEKMFQEKYPEEFSDFVRQYMLFSFRDTKNLSVILIPIEKSYEYKWRYSYYNSKAKDVRTVTYDVEKKELKEPTWLYIEE